MLLGLELKGELWSERGVDVCGHFPPKSRQRYGGSGENGEKYVYK